MVCVFCQKYTTSIVKTYLQEIQIWKLEEAPAEITEKVKRTWFFVMLYMFVVVVFTLVVSVSYMIPTSQDKEFIFCFNLVNTYFPQLEFFFELFMKPIVFVLTYMGVSTPGFSILYYYGHANLQKLMIMHYLQNINANYTTVEDISSTCVEYQQIVNKSLLFCVKNHIHFVM